MEHDQIEFGCMYNDGDMYIYMHSECLDLTELFMNITVRVRSISRLF